MVSREEMDGCSEETEEREAWLKASEQALMRVWDNLEDAVYDELLKDSKDNE